MGTPGKDILLEANCDAMGKQICYPTDGLLKIAVLLMSLDILLTKIAGSVVELAWYLAAMFLLLINDMQITSAN